MTLIAYYTIQNIVVYVWLSRLICLDLETRANANADTSIEMRMPRFSSDLFL